MTHGPSDSAAFESEAPAAQPVGEPVDDRPAPRPRRVVLAGRHVSLSPLDPGAHAEGLFEAIAGPDHDRLWTYLANGPFRDRAAFAHYLVEKAAPDDPYLLTIVDSAEGRPQGIAAFMRIEPQHRVIEVGNIVFGPALQRTRGATESMYLMARHAFEDLGYRRYEWKCNALNLPSRDAALRLGFTFEGIFRQHMIAKGRNRDTAWFSMLDSEWPARRARFERWLDPGNFDADGRQKSRLSAADR